MAAEFQNLNTTASNQFLKGMQKDLSDVFLPEGSWSHARNATVNTPNGDMATLSNEQSTLLCAVAPYNVIGYLFFNDDEWIIFSTDDVTEHEIGIFNESLCTYTKIVNDPCLNFSSSFPIRSGGVKESFDCNRYFYWDDGRNPTRFLSPTKIPYIQQCTTSPTGCVTCVDAQPLQLDCTQITLAPKIKVPCVTIRKASYGGELINGSYQAVVAYTINQQRFGDYYAITNPQPIFNHIGIGGSIEVEVTDLDSQYFSEFELIIVYTVSGNTIAKRFGFYSTSEDARIGISIIPDSLQTVPLAQLPVRRPVYEKSDATYSLGDYLLRVGPRSRFSFNYQPLANQIRSYYQIWEVDSNYYKNGGNLTGYMSDEVYPFFIRFLYNTGERSESYHIPGRNPNAIDLAPIAPASNNFDNVSAWEGLDTSIPSGNPNIPYTDPGTGIEGTIIAQGRMSYWESSEKYPNDSVRYGSLCNEKIRHHKFPSRTLDPVLWHHNNGGSKIRILGVRFDNILPPTMPDPNNPALIINVPDIVGYEILRGSREGNKTVVAKGIFNNMLTYKDPAIPGNLRSAIQNFPYNDVRGSDSVLQAPQSIFPSGNCDAINSASKAKFVRDQHYSFHSPDTQFKEPFLSPYEAKQYGVIQGELDRAQFTPVENHPKHKLPSDLAFFIAMFAGLVVGVKMVSGKTRISTIDLPQVRGNDMFQNSSAVGVPALPTPGVVSTISVPALTAALGAISSIPGSADLVSKLAQALLGFTTSGDKLLTSSSTSLYDSLFSAYITAAKNNPAFQYPKTTLTVEESQYEGLPGPLKVFYGIPIFLNAWSEGTDEFLELIMKLVPYRQYAYQFRSHCFYNQSFDIGLNRRSVLDSGYIGSGVYNTQNIRVDNTMRNKYVYIELANLSFNHPGSLNNDNSRFSIGTDSNWDNPERIIQNKHSATIYGALINKIVNQYGQLDSINQIPVSSCLIRTESSWVYDTGILFGGDIYIGRHTEKNPFFFFRNWLQNKPDGYEIDYRKYNTLPLLPRYWMNTEQYDLVDFVRGIGSSIGALFTNPTDPYASFNSIPPTVFPSDLRSLDQNPAVCNDFAAMVANARFAAKKAYMYLFYSGVRDFFVESEINVDLRDWSDEERFEHYKPYGNNDLNALFHPDVIRERELYKYDFSLSHSKIFYDKVSWGNIQPRSYDPITYQNCYTYDPGIVIYSLPDNKGLLDAWRVYLPDNYKKISGTIVNIKSINKNGALMVFDDRSPVMIQGSDSLQTDLGTKVILGDGGLFEQAMQNISSSDLSYMEGSCLDTYGVINCAAGVFVISHTLRKIYRVKGQGSLEDITAKGMKWWFNNHMGYRILEDFPSFPDINNLAIGVGSFITYDQESSILYFTKRDYAINPQTAGTWNYTYTGKGKFLLSSKNIPGLKLRNIPLDSKYFVDTSWTISFDPKTDSWISFHDWHPNYTLPARAKFVAINKNSFWKHNVRLDSFCNFYGIEYPWEVEVPVNPKGVSVLGSVEYYMDAVLYDNQADVSRTLLDANFDRAVVYNKEQCSGLLRMVPYPRTNPYLALQYPLVAPGLIDILYSKEENKYGFDQFYDIVNDRGEVSNNPQPIWLVGKDGYKKQLNLNALNYNKSDFEQKRMRNYFQKVFLSKTISGAVNFVFKIFNSKSIISPR